KRLALVERAAIGVQAALEVLGVHVVGPAVAELLRHRAADEVEPRLVEPGAELVGAAHPDQHRRRVGDLAEAPLALFGDVPALALGGDLASGCAGRRERVPQILDLAHANRPGPDYFTLRD